MNTIKESRTYGEIVVVNVDIQNDFALPTGALSVPDGEAVIPAANRVNEYVRAQGGQVVFTQDWHRADNEKHFAKWPVHCVQHKAGAALHDGLDVRAQDTIVHKGMYLEDDGYSGWEGELVAGTLTALVEHLPTSERTLGRALGMLAGYAAERGERIAYVVEGLATDYCDLATVVDIAHGTDRDIADVYLVTDAMRAVDVNPGDGDRALAAMLEAKALAISTDELINGGIVIDRTRLER